MRISTNRSTLKAKTAATLVVPGMVAQPAVAQASPTHSPAAPQQPNPVSPKKKGTSAVAVTSTTNSPLKKAAANTTRVEAQPNTAIVSAPPALVVVSSETLLGSNIPKQTMLACEKVSIDRGGGSVDQLLWSIEHFSKNTASSTQHSTAPTTSSSSISGRFRGLVMRDGSTLQKVSAWRPKPKDGNEMVPMSLVFVPALAYHSGQQKRRQNATIWSAWGADPTVLPSSSGNNSNSRRASGFIVIFDAVDRHVLQCLDLADEEQQQHNDESTPAAVAPRLRVPRGGRGISLASSSSASPFSSHLSQQPSMLCFSTYNHRVYALHEAGGTPCCVLSSFAPQPPHELVERVELPFPLNGTMSAEAVAIALDHTQQFLFVVTDRMHVLILSLASSPLEKATCVVRTFRPRDFASVAQNPASALSTAIAWFRAEHEGHVLLPEYFYDNTASVSQEVATRTTTPTTGASARGGKSASPHKKQRSEGASSPPPRARKSAPQPQKGAGSQPGKSAPAPSPKKQPSLSSGGSVVIVPSISYSNSPSRLDDGASTVRSTATVSVATQAHHHPGAAAAAGGTAMALAGNNGSATAPWYVVHRSVSRPASSIGGAEDHRSGISASSASGRELVVAAVSSVSSKNGRPTGSSQGLFAQGTFVQKAIDALSRMHELRRLGVYYRDWLNFIRLQCPFSIDASVVAPSSSSAHHHGMASAQNVLVVPADALFSSSSSSPSNNVSDDVDGSGPRLHRLLEVCLANRVTIWVVFGQHSAGDDIAERRVLAYVHALKRADRNRRIISAIVSIPASAAEQQAQRRKVVCRNVHASRLFVVSTSPSAHFSQIWQGVQDVTRGSYKRAAAVIFCPTQSAGYNVSSDATVNSLAALVGTAGELSRRNALLHFPAGRDRKPSPPSMVMPAEPADHLWSSMLLASPAISQHTECDAFGEVRDMLSLSLL